MLALTCVPGIPQFIRLRLPVFFVFAFSLQTAVHADEGSQPSANDKLQTFIAWSGQQHGEAGRRAAQFLVDNMPEVDRQTLSADFLQKNLDLAFASRDSFVWARHIPEEIFLNDVLPYAVFDEPRDAWRTRFMEQCRALVKDCHTASEVAQTLNRDFFNLIKVHYNTGRKFTNASPLESIDEGRATCTGLTILLVEACRSVGIPARAAGIARWPHKAGNHTWTEIWDGDWQFAGSDEYDPAGLNHTWFVDDAAQAIADHPANAIYATSWKATGELFPLVWPARDDAPQPRPLISAINVTRRYTQSTPPPSTQSEVSFRLTDQTLPGPDKRIQASITLLNEIGRVLGSAQTKAGTADLNDMPRLSVEPHRNYVLQVDRDGQSRETILHSEDAGQRVLDLSWQELALPSSRLAPIQAWLQAPSKTRSTPPALPLTRLEAEHVRGMLWQDLVRQIRAERNTELSDQKITYGQWEMPWLEKTFGQEPPGGHSLWISMHGGGNAPTKLNDQQWHNQILLYELTEGIYVAPRAPTDTWNMWHQDHIDPMFDRLIADYVALRGVNPDKVHLLGYSAGGDGVCQLAPRMADRFASVAMMAGHPNDASPQSLRNLPFALLVGADDTGYGRNQIAAQWADSLDRLQEGDPDGYEHFVRMYPNTGHWMNRRDAEALPWMAKFVRDPWPRRIVWEQGHLPTTRFYWLSLPHETPGQGDRIDAEVTGQHIRLQSTDYHHILLRLSDDLLDLDQPLTVEANGQTVFSGKIQRSTAALYHSLQDRMDPTSAAPAELEVCW